MKKALITGITGQDGAYLAEFLLEKKYEVHGITRRASTSNTCRIDHLIDQKKIILHTGDLTDAASITRIIALVKPDEIYNLGAQSHVGASFEIPVYTAHATGMGIVHILEALRTLNLTHTKVYQASSSELFGSSAPPQSETTPFYPRSPYAAAKLYAYWMVINYRQAYHLFACNGILFNHESPLRGELFVTKKITQAVVNIIHNQQAQLTLGNLDARRDWGFAGDYVEAMWLMLQQENAQDFVIATQQSHSVREFVEKAFAFVGIDILWQGTGVHERGINAADNQTLITVDQALFRPTEVDYLLGDASKAQNMLGWKPRTNFDELVQLMMHEELKQFHTTNKGECHESNNGSISHRRPGLSTDRIPHPEKSS
jgi:GDPmannose 4,6-dehydratase